MMEIKKRYNETVDILRAVLILLVILVHIVNFGDIYPGVKYSVLAFFMPAFLVITGYLVNVRKTLKQFCSYILQIALPYIIMVSGFMVLSLYLPVRGGVQELTLDTVCRVLFVTSIGPYWYFRIMIICGVLYYAAFRLLPERYGVVARYSLFAALLIAVSYLTPALTLKAAAYYFIGVGVRVFGNDISSIIRPSFFTVLPFLLLICNDSFHDWGALSILACSLCFFSFTAKAGEYMRGSLRTAMLYLGRNTFPVYVFHPIFTMLSKYCLPLFSFDPSGLLHTAFTILLATAGSLGIGIVMDRLHLTYVFGKAKMMR